MTFKGNIKRLNKILDLAPRASKDKIRELIKLYEKRSIPKFRSVELASVKLANPGLFKDSNKSYTDLLNRYQEAEPVTGILSRPPKRKRESVETFLIMYRNRSDDDGGEVAQATAVGASVSIKKYLSKKYADLKQKWVGRARVSGQHEQYLVSMKDKLVRPKDDKRNFKRLHKILVEDPVIAGMESNMSGGATAAILIVSVDTAMDDVAPVDPADIPKRSDGKVAITFKYKTNKIDMTKETFKEAIAKQNYIKDECWINALYEVYGTTLLSSNKQQRYVITRAKILETIGRTEENIKNGLTWKDIEPFFVKYNIQARILDQYYKVRHRYDPPKINHNNKVFFAMYDDDHIYVLDHNVARLSQILDDDTTEFTVSTSNDYYVDEEKKPLKHRMIETIDDILKIVKEIKEAIGTTTEEGEEEASTDAKQEMTYLVHKQDDLEHLLWDLHGAGYTPQIKYLSGRVASIVLELENIKFSVRCQQLNLEEADGMLDIEQEGVYNKTNEASTDMGNKLFRKDHKSYYNQDDINILDEYRTIPNVGVITDINAFNGRLKRKDPKISERDLVEIDISKAHTAAFAKIKHIPIFNEFDIWKKYNNEPLKPYNLYQVKRERSDLFDNKTTNLAYGMFLKDEDRPFITNVKEPSNIRKVSYASIIEELWQTKISENPVEDATIKKTICNTHFGMLEKSFNKNSVSSIHTEYGAAKHYQAIYGGTIHTLQKYEQRDVSYIDPLDVGINMDDDDDDEGCVRHRTEFVETDERLYILSLESKASLHNGFRYIKELLLQFHNYYLNKSFRALRDKGITVFTVKTDAFTVLKGDLEEVKKLLDFGAGFGKWRVSKEKDINFPYNPFEKKITDDMPIKVYTNNHIELTIEDEYNVDKLCNIFETNKRVMIRADLPGSGKSYSCESMVRRGHSVLFVCPTNELAKKYDNKDRLAGITLNKFFGIGISEHSKISKFDDSDFDVIVFDEIFFYKPNILARISRYCRENEGKIIIATGESTQLEPVGSISNTLDYDYYTNHCVNMIFENLLHFKENKRLKTKEDKEKLKLIKQELFDENIPIERTMRKHFPFVIKVRTDKNVAYKNSTCKEIGILVRKRQKKAHEYDVNDILICRKYFKSGKNVFNVNYTYTIKKIVKGLIYFDKDLVPVPLDVVRKNFIYNSCQTGHSLQGSTIDEKITIFDWNFEMVSRKWVWVAITRATSLDNVFFYEYTEPTMDKKMIDDYIKMKIDHYKSQDVKAKRAISYNYIDKQWFLQHFKSNCVSCGCSLGYEIENGKLTCNLTANRLNNDEDHHKENIEPMCCRCNCSLSNRG